VRRENIRRRKNSENARKRSVPIRSQYRAYGIWVVNSVKGKEEGGRRGAVPISVRCIYSVFVPY
jgi:hypothetical protein